MWSVTTAFVRFSLTRTNTRCPTFACQVVVANLFLHYDVAPAPRQLGGGFGRPPQTMPPFDNNLMLPVTPQSMLMAFRKRERRADGAEAPPPDLAVPLTM